MSPLTAMRTMAPRTACGRSARGPVRNKRRRGAREATGRARGDFAPALSFTADWERPPATRYPCPRPEARLAAPSPSSSCRVSRGSLCFEGEGPRRGDALHEHEQEARERERASVHLAERHLGNPILGSPLRRSPVRATPCWARGRNAAAAIPGRPPRGPLGGPGGSARPTRAGARRTAPRSVSTGWVRRPGAPGSTAARRNCRPPGDAQDLRHLAQRRWPSRRPP